ncbi:hypothetical protein AB0P15_03105 [Streptomyces sp. NPDC087917]|uniref:hypothetical protein n=1 Tax=Streptomyces sp. NPDC087917 TaxID=3155060 RepID=UPI003431C086
MRKLTWAARCIAAASGVMLAAAVVAPSAVAYSGPDPKPAAKPGKQAPRKQAPAKQAQSKPAPSKPSTAPAGDGSKRCQTSRDVDSAVVDYSGSGLFETIFHTATDQRGHAFLNDSRNPGVWIDLGLVAGAPTCVYDAAVAVTEENPGHLYLTLLDRKGTLHQARCTTTSTPFTPANLATACAPGFTALSDTPV